MTLSRKDKESFLKVFLDPDGDPDHPNNHQLFLVYRCQAVLKISSKSTNKFLSTSVANSQTNASNNKISLVDGFGIWLFNDTWSQ